MSIYQRMNALKQKHMDTRTQRSIDSETRLKHSQFMLKCSMTAFIISTILLWLVIIWRLF